MPRRLHTDLGSHIAALYDERGNIEAFVPVRGPVQDESKFADDDELNVMRRIEAGARAVA